MFRLPSHFTVLSPVDLLIVSIHEHSSLASGSDDSLNCRWIAFNIEFSWAAYRKILPVSPLRSALSFLINSKLGKPPTSVFNHCPVMFKSSVLVKHMM